VILRANRAGKAINTLEFSTVQPLGMLIYFTTDSVTSGKMKQTQEHRLAGENKKRLNT